MRWLLRRLEDFLWPRGVQCLCCDRCTDGGLLCPDCEGQLEQLRLPPSVGPVRSAWAYGGSAKRLVLGLKEQCVADCARILARGMVEVIREMDLPCDTVLTWVTMPQGRRLRRGIDHGRLLCEAVSELTGLAVRELMTRRGGGHTQRGLSRAKRQQNLKGRFACQGRISGTVLLIDDVLTTGATAQVCSEALRQGGAEAVYVLTATCVTSYDNQ